ncbi:MAG: CTP synthase, partial [Sphingomonadales bacterium]
MARYIFITGGVVSSLGKGLMGASLAALLQARGYKCRIRKFDPYLNVDPGTMSPHQHGEVYVTDDGAETDLDLGHYERFTGVASRQSDNVTSGRIYKTIIERERRGDYLGATVQVIPHVTDAIKAFAQDDTDGLDFVLCEIGGTVGDIESLPFVEAIRQLRNDLGRGQTVSVHLTLVPYIAAAGELKTKPTQHSVRELASLGVHADVIVCRSERPLPASDRAKIALFCNVPASAVIPALDADTIYSVPLQYHREGLDIEVLRAFGIEPEGDLDLSRWDEIVDRVKNPEGEVTIGVVGKYMGVPDAYKSLTEALTHGGIANRVKVNIRWLDAELFEQDDGDEVTAMLEPMHGILVPGGFGERGSEGKIAGVRFARHRKVPFFGICLGMQMACIEGVRSEGIENASTTEFGETAEPVVGMITEWMTAEGLQKREAGGDMGGTMRLGAYPAKL